MANKKFNLSSTTWGQEEIAAIQDVISSGNFTIGSKVKSFEEDFAAYHNQKFSVMVNSGSSANLLMIAALFFTREKPLKAGDEVIVPAVSWSTTFTPLQQLGLKLKFIDIDIDTLNFDLDSLAEAISDKTRLIMCVNLLGNPNKFDEIYQLISKRDIKLIEDNCESLGAKYHNQLTGTFGLMGSFSTYFSHHISTMEGGLVVTDDEELYHIMLSLRSHGWTRSLPQNSKIYKKIDDEFYESFNFILPGYNLRPLELEGAIGIEQLKKLNKFVQCRRDNASRFQEVFAKKDHIRIQKEIGQSSWFGFSLIPCDNKKESFYLLKDFLVKSGFEVRPIVAGNFLRNKVIDYFDYSISGEMVNANHVHDNGLFIGNHHYDMSEAFEELAKL